MPTLENERVILTKQEAYEVLPQIHTFLNPGFMLVGADWSIKNLVDAIETAHRIEIGGEACRSMKHGLVIWRDEKTPVFVACDDEALQEMEKEAGPND